MNLQEYAEVSRKTWHKDDVSKKQQLEHATLGLIDEIGEIASCIKKNVGYGKEIDFVNLKEELGDLLYFFCRFIEANYGMNRILKDWTDDFVWHGNLFGTVMELHISAYNIITAPYYNRELVRDFLVDMNSIINLCDFTLDDVMDANIAKLKARYGDALEFSQELALNRDLNKEREALK